MVIGKLHVFTNSALPYSSTRLVRDVTLGQEDTSNHWISRLAFWIPEFPSLRRVVICETSAMKDLELCI